MAEEEDVLGKLISVVLGGCLSIGPLEKGRCVCVCVGVEEGMLPVFHTCSAQDNAFLATQHSHAHTHPHGLYDVFLIIIILIF